MQENSNKTNRLLTVIAGLLVRGNGKGKETRSLKEQIEVLADLGVRPIEIAEILGRPAKYVNKELSRIRKMKK